MKNIQPRQPSHVTPYVRACLDALVRTGLAKHISLGGAFGLFHYLDYRTTHDIDAWWSEVATDQQRKTVVQELEKALSQFGKTRVRSWGDVVSVEVIQNDKPSFSFQIASRSAQITEPIPAGWIDVSLDSLPDLVASKMVALVERGAPRDFLDVYEICQAGLLTRNECWSLWRQRQEMTSDETDPLRARLAVESHLERIAIHRPLDKVADETQRERSRAVRDWFSGNFLKVGDD